VKKRSVGLVLYTVVKGKVVAVLHRRGGFTFTDELDVRDESWPGGCQVSSHGKWKDGDGEGSIRTVLREIREELGDPTANLVAAQQVHLQVLSTKDGETEAVTTYGLLVANPQELLPYIRLSAESGGLVLVNRNQPLANLRDYPKAEGVTDRRVVALFPDEIEAVRKGFELFPDAA
jgi:hypothetical protein